MATLVREESVKTVERRALATVREACEFLHVGRSTLNKMVAQGELHFVGLGVRARRIRWSELIDIAGAERNTEESQ
jgi:excisionase family DNA binding protein